MRRNQVMALLLSAVLSVSAFVQLGGISAFAAQDEVDEGSREHRGNHASPMNFSCRRR